MDESEFETETTEFVSIIGDVLECSLLFRALSQFESISNSSKSQTNELSWNHDLGIVITVNRLKITRLIVSHCGITTFNSLALAFSQVQDVNISFNNVKELDCLSVAVNIRFLDISHNRISSLSFLSALNNLNVLRCHNNIVESLEDVKSCTQLQELWVSNNRIPWQQFVHLSSLKVLEVLIKGDRDKSTEESKKLDTFLINIVPSLRILDGSPVSGMADQGLSVDVKIMLTQARAALNACETADNRISSKASATRKKPQLPNRISKKGSRGSRLNEDSSAGEDSETAPSSRGAEGDTEGDAIRSNGLAREVTTEPTVANERAPGGANATHGRSTMATSRKIPSRKYPPSAAASSSAAASAVRRDHESTSDVGQEEEEQGKEEGGGKGQSLVPETVVRFPSSTSDAPIALCIYANKDGYARWSRGGPMACSVENGRMLASYKAGSVALVFDRRAGNGSVMDTRGRCLFVISEHCSARVLDRSSGATLKELKKDALAAADKEPAATTKWLFEGLDMQFDPLNWELSVRLENEKVECLFSSVSGCSLIREKKDTAKKEKKKASFVRSPRLATADEAVVEGNKLVPIVLTSMSPPNKSSSSNSAGGATQDSTNAPSTQISRRLVAEKKQMVKATSRPKEEPVLMEDHEALRKDIRAVFAGLDSALAGLRGVQPTGDSGAIT